LRIYVLKWVKYALLIFVWAKKKSDHRKKLNGHSPGSDGPMFTALKRYNGGRVLVFVVVMGAFAEMPGDVSRIFLHL